MRTVLAILTVALLLTVAPMGQVVANSGGKFNSSGGCGCHGYNAVTAQLNGVPTDYTPGSTYAITVGMGTSPTTGGFSLAVTQGQFSNPDANTRLNSNAKQATHDYSYGTTSWSFDWTAPSTGSGTVDVEIAVNTVNGNSAASGDAWTTSSITIPRRRARPTPAPTAANVYISDAPGPATAITKAYYDATLYANYDYSDQEGDSESGTEIRWLKGGISQAQYDDQPTLLRAHSPSATCGQ